MQREPVKLLAHRCGMLVGHTQTTSRAEISAISDMASRIPMSCLVLMFALIIQT